MRKILVPLVLFASAFAFGVQADPVRTTEDIVQHFIKSAKLGQTRAICIGTEMECKAKAEAPLEPIELRVNFELNSANLSADAHKELERFAAAFNDPRLEIATFEVDGHTDARGTEIFNDSLSVQRAETVTKVLIELGVAPGRIQSHGYGKSRPLTSDPFADVNRRVEARMVLPSE